jgi:hypothetical protein
LILEDKVLAPKDKVLIPPAVWSDGLALYGGKRQGNETAAYEAQAGALGK